MYARVGKGSLSGMLLMAVFLAHPIALGDEPGHSRFLPDDVMNSLKTVKTFERPNSNVPLKEKLLFDMAATHETVHVTDSRAWAVEDEKAAKEGGLTVQQRQTLPPKITPEFRRYMLFFLNPFRVPDVEFIRSHLTFLDSAHSVSGADVAYLDYEVDGRAFRVAQTGMYSAGSIAICIELKPADLGDAASPRACTAAINTLLARYLVEDPGASFAMGDLEPVDAQGNYWIKQRPERPDSYRQTSFGAVSARGVCIVFRNKHPWYKENEHHIGMDPPIPARIVPPGEWFGFFFEPAKKVAQPPATLQVDKKER